MYISSCQQDQTAGSNLIINCLSFFIITSVYIHSLLSALKSQNRLLFTCTQYAVKIRTAGISKHSPDAMKSSCLTTSISLHHS